MESLMQVSLNPDAFGYEETHLSTPKSICISHYNKTQMETYQHVPQRLHICLPLVHSMQNHHDSLTPHPATARIQQLQCKNLWFDANFVTKELDFHEQPQDFSEETWDTLEVELPFQPLNYNSKSTEMSHTETQMFLS